MPELDDSLDPSTERPWIILPPDDPFMTISMLEDKKQYEVKFAKYLLNKLNKFKIKKSFRNYLICLGDYNVDRNIIIFTVLFYENLEKQNLLQNLEFKYQTIKKGNFIIPKSWYAKFDAYYDKLSEYLKDFIKTHGLLHDKTIILVEPNFGFYKNGIRDKCYHITQKGEGKKNFSLINTLVNCNDGLPASKLAAIVNIRSNKVSDMSKQINGQFKKHCELFHDVITLKPDGNYCINDKFLIKDTKNL